MARIEGIENPGASLFTRLVYFMTKRRLGRVITPIKIKAHHPRLLRAMVHMELGQQSAGSVPLHLKAIADIKVAMMVGCPF